MYITFKCKYTSTYGIFIYKHIYCTVSRYSTCNKKQKQQKFSIFFKYFFYFLQQQKNNKQKKVNFSYF